MAAAAADVGDVDVCPVGRDEPGGEPNPVEHEVRPVAQ